MPREVPNILEKGGGGGLKFGGGHIFVWRKSERGKFRVYSEENRLFFSYLLGR